MPIVNTLAFLFTVVGDWWVDGKVISQSTLPHPIPHPRHLKPYKFTDTMAGMVLSLAGIALCVQSKNT